MYVVSPFHNWNVVNQLTSVILNIEFYSIQRKKSGNILHIKL